MVNIMAGSLGGFVPPVEPRRLAVMSLVVNNVCNLHCSHCYLAPDGPALGMRPEAWRRLLSSVLCDLRPRALCFSGKEVFARSDSAALLFDALTLRASNQGDDAERTRIGAISNGTLLAAYRHQLMESPPDWLDISIDGLDAAHDAIRGPGSFRRTTANLPWLLELLGDRLWITPTMMSANLEAMPQLIATLHQRFGVRRFSLGIYKAQPYTDGRLAIRDHGREERILAMLWRLVALRHLADVVVKVDFDSGDRALRSTCERAGLLPTAGIVRSATHHLGNGVTLAICTTSVPVGLWRAVRVTNEGLWLAAEDLVNVTEYSRHATCQVEDVRCDSRRAYNMGLQHRRFETLVGTTADRFFAMLEAVNTIPVEQVA